MQTDIHRDSPRRFLPKQDAVRHLIHAAIRLTMAAEDPFAIHLLVQSADKLLIDLGVKLGKPMEFDWETVIRPDRKKEFFDMWREAYNYLKHADRDQSNDLPVRDIARMNVMTLFINIANYHSLYGTYTAHMNVYLMFMQLIAPDIFVYSEEMESTAKTNRASLSDMTPTELFAIVRESMPEFAPTFRKEQYEDLIDVHEFYSTPFSKMKKE